MIGSTFVQKLFPRYRDDQEILDGVCERVCWPKQGFGMTIHEGPILES